MMKKLTALMVSGLGISVSLALISPALAMQDNNALAYTALQSSVQSDVSNLLYSLRGNLIQNPSNTTLVDEVSSIQTDAGNFVFVSRSLYGQIQNRSALENKLSELQGLTRKINFTLRSILNQNQSDSVLANEVSLFELDSGTLLFNLRKTAIMPLNK